jgi:hypothetical protein
MANELEFQVCKACGWPMMIRDNTAICPSLSCCMVGKRVALEPVGERLEEERPE